MSHILTKITEGKIEQLPITVLWTFEHDGEIRDIEAETQADAQKAADDWFEQRVIDLHDDLRNGDKLDDEIKLVSFYYNDAGDRKIIERIPAFVEYEHYHGDHREHSYP